MNHNLKVKKIGFGCLSTCKKHKASVVTLAVVLFATTLINAQPVERTRMLAGMLNSIKAQNGEDAALGPILEKAMQQAKSLESRICPTMRGSDFYKVNDNAGKDPIKVSEDALKLMLELKGLTKTTEGAFDVTTGALLSLFPSNKNSGNSAPSAEELKQQLEYVGMDKVQIKEEEAAIFLPQKKMKLDMFEVCRMALLDKESEVLKESKLKSFSITLSGDHVIGEPLHGKDGWEVVLDNPRKRGSPMGWIILSNVSVVTSGDYESPVIYRGKRYHNIINPQNGEPVSDVRSAMVIAKDPMTAFAFSRAFMVWGAKKSLDYCAANSELDAVIVDSSGNLHISSGIKDKFKLGEPPADVNSLKAY